MGNAWVSTSFSTSTSFLGWTEGCQGFDKKTYLHRGLPANQGFNRREAVEKHGPQVSQVQETTDLSTFFSPISKESNGVLVEGCQVVWTRSLASWVVGFGTLGMGATWNIQKDEQVDVLIQQVDDLNIFKFYILSNNMMSLATFWPSPGWLSDTPTFGVRLVWHYQVALEWPDPFREGSSSNAGATPVGWWL